MILSYSIFVNGILKKQTMSNEFHNESISNLAPGTQYRLKISVDFIGNISKVAVLKVSTYPEKPGQIRVKQNTYSMRIRLKMTAGTIDYYHVLSTSTCTSPTFMNVSYEVDKAIDSKNDIILITEPGACCSLDVAAVSNNISGKVQTYTVKRRETVPGFVIQPSVKINEMTVTILWSAPNQHNGIIVEYTMQLWSSRGINIIRFFCTDCRGSTECDHQEKQKTWNVNATTTVHFMGDNNGYNRTFQREQTTFNVTVERLPANLDYYYTIYASTRQGNGSMYTASFNLKSDLVPSQNQDKGIIAGAVTGTFVCTTAVMLIVFFICKQYRNKLREKSQKKSTQHYQDIELRSEENVYQTLDSP